MDPQHLSAFSRLRGLLEVTRLVRSDEDLDHLLAAIARTTAESLGFGTVVLNLYRRAWDDFCTTTVHGSEHARETLLGDARGWDVWGRVLDDRSLELVNGGAQATSTTCNNCQPGALGNPVTNDCKTWNCKP